MVSLLKSTSLLGFFGSSQHTLNKQQEQESQHQPDIDSVLKIKSSRKAKTAKSFDPSQQLYPPRNCFNSINTDTESPETATTDGDDESIDFLENNLSSNKTSSDFFSPKTKKSKRILLKKRSLNQVKSLNSKSVSSLENKLRKKNSSTSNDSNGSSETSEGKKHKKRQSSYIPVSKFKLHSHHPPAEIVTNNSFNNIAYKEKPLSTSIVESKLPRSEYSLKRFMIIVNLMSFLSQEECSEKLYQDHKSDIVDEDVDYLLSVIDILDDCEADTRSFRGAIDEIRDASKETQAALLKTLWLPASVTLDLDFDSPDDCRSSGVTFITSLKDQERLLYSRFLPHLATIIANEKLTHTTPKDLANSFGPIFFPNSSPKEQMLNNKTLEKIITSFVFIYKL